VHPFFYVDAEIPAIGGYDLLRAAHIIIDTQSAEVWSKHPDAVNQSCISENIFATPTFVWWRNYSTFPPTFCVTEDTRSPAIETAPHSLNPFAPSFDRDRRSFRQRLNRMIFKVSCLVRVPRIHITMVITKWFCCFRRVIN